MAQYSANRPNRTLTLHKDDCSEIGRESSSICGCESTSEHGNSRWFCELHVTIDVVSEFMGGRFWAIPPCGKCYANK